MVFNVRKGEWQPVSLATLVELRAMSQDSNVDIEESTCPSCQKLAQQSLNLIFIEGVNA